MGFQKRPRRIICKPPPKCMFPEALKLSPPRCQSTSSVQWHDEGLRCWKSVIMSVQKVGYWSNGVQCWKSINVVITSEKKARSGAWCWKSINITIKKDRNGDGVKVPFWKLSNISMKREGYGDTTDSPSTNLKTHPHYRAMGEHFAARACAGTL